MTSEDNTPKLRLGQQISYSAPNFAMNLSGVLFASWLTYFYLPPDDEITGRVALVAASAFAIAQLFGRVVDALADPFVGYWSDRCRGRWGRRLPFLLFGSPVLAISFLAMWFPPFAPGSLGNSIYLIATLCFYWFAFTLVVAPYFALLPEIAKSNKARVLLSSSMAIFTVLGMAVGNFAIGPVQSAYPDGINLFGWHIPTGIQFMAILSAVVLLLLFWTPLINIREAAYTPAKEVPKGLFTGLLTAFRNPAFKTYLAMACLIQMGVTLIGASLPYLATQVLAAKPGGDGLIPAGEGETWAGILGGVVVVLAALCFPLVNILVPKLGKKKLFVLAGIMMATILFIIPIVTLFPDPAIPAFVLFVGLSFPLSAALVLPNAIYADVVDFDADQSGIRREGTYTGATALVTKAGIGLAQAAVVALLVFGNTRANPTGILLCFPLGALFVGLGTWLFSKHPIDK